LNNELVNVLLDRLCVAVLFIALAVLNTLEAETTRAPVDSSYVMVAFCGMISNVNDPLLLSTLATTGNVLDVIERLAALVSVYSTNVMRLTILSVCPLRISVPSLLTSMIDRLLAPIGPQPIGPLPNPVKLQVAP
jgi:hypothetical protein